MKNGKRSYCYFCSASKLKIGVPCTNAYIHEIPLMEAAAEAMNWQLRLLGKIENKEKDSKEELISMELLNILIDKILVYSPEKIKVTCRFADELEKWRQEIQADIPQEREQRIDRRVCCEVS